MCSANKIEGDVIIAIMLNGADLSKNIQHFTSEIKIVDPRAVNTLTCNMIGIEFVKSREFCFPFKFNLNRMLIYYQILSNTVLINL